MKLYYLPGACSMASHITVHELKLPVQLVRMDMATHTIEGGKSYYDVNPEGYVPALEFDDGAVMTESAAVLQYLADSAAPNTMLAPAGSLARYRTVEMISFVSTEIHQSLRPLLNPASDDAAKSAVNARIQKRLGRLERLLAKTAFLTGSDFTVADAYAFAIIGALRHFQVPLSDFPKVLAFHERVGSRPAVIATLRAEGLIP